MIDFRKLMVGLPAFIGLAVFVFLLCAGFLVEGGLASLIQFLTESAKFVPQVIVIVLIALFVVFVSQFIRSREWFDRRGAAAEMAIVEERIGGQKEKAGDSTSIAIKYSATTFLIGVVLLAFFLMHG